MSRTETAIGCILIAGGSVDNLTELTYYMVEFEQQKDMNVADFVQYYEMLYSTWLQIIGTYSTVHGWWIEWRTRQRIDSVGPFQRHWHKPIGYTT
jgi:hypothetical protein